VASRRMFLQSAALAAGVTGAASTVTPAGAAQGAGQDQVIVFAEFYAKPGKENELRKLLLGLIGPTRKDKGYVQYDLHADNENPLHFFFVEKWTSKALLDAHLAAPHLTAFAAKANDLLAQPRRVVMGRHIG
jgi:quinol monooxygenase YgiN